jgi:putative FmdB family regulatory protein
MPLYEFRCLNCSNHFEVLVRAQEGALCPSCESQNLEKLVSVFSMSTSNPTQTQPMGSGCGQCGDPRGPGACRTDVV